MRHILLAVMLCLLGPSCAIKRVQIIDCAEGLEGKLVVPVTDSVVTVRAKARIELTRYRVRGTCRIQRFGLARTRIDFHHSSLFGAYREDASLYISDEELIIYDRERERYYGTDSSLAILREYLGFDVRPDDILYALLFRVPACSDIEGMEAVVQGGEWRLSGRWRGRRIAIDGDVTGRTTRFELCPPGEIKCYEIRYGYSDRAVGTGYPKRIEIERLGDEERISLQVLDVGIGTIEGGISYDQRGGASAPPGPELPCFRELLCVPGVIPGG